MSDLFEASGFVFVFPLWIVTNPNLGSQDFLKAVHPDGEIATPIFTDEDLAQSFLDQQDESPGEYIVRPLEPWAFLGLLAVLHRKGFSHVLIDPAGEKGRGFPIAKLLAEVLAWF
jgi:hypothetical protein